MSEYYNFDKFLSKMLKGDAYLIPVDMKESFKDKCNRVAIDMGIKAFWDEKRNGVLFKFDERFRTFLKYPNKNVTHSDIADFLCKQYQLYKDIKEGK